MDSDQVRARIIEVGQRVKPALLERGLSAEEIQPGYKYVAGEAKQRPRPFWSEERGYKYIDDVDDHLRRLAKSFDFLDPRPGSAVFEIGPGSCFFLVLCRELRGCRVAGVDWIEDEAADQDDSLRMPFHDLQKYAFRLFREHFGLADVVRHQVVKAHQPIAFGGQYDAIVATRAMFNRGWQEGEYRYWLEDCYRHLWPEGHLMVHLNKLEPEHLAVFPFLRPVPVPGGVKKLSRIARETIGQALEGSTRRG